MSIPQNKDWKAWIDLMPGPSIPTLHVTGKVETNAGNMQPVLSRRNPQGINPKILILDLTIEKTGDFGTADVAYRDVHYSESAEKGQYSDTHIFFNKQEVVLQPVEEVH